MQASAAFSCADSKKVQDICRKSLESGKDRVEERFKNENADLERKIATAEGKDARSGVRRMLRGTEHRSSVASLKAAQDKGKTKHDEAVNYFKSRLTQNDSKSIAICEGHVTEIREKKKREFTQKIQESMRTKVQKLAEEKVSRRWTAQTIDNTENRQSVMSEALEEINKVLEDDSNLQEVSSATAKFANFLGGPDELKNLIALSHVYPSGVSLRLLMFSLRFGLGVFGQAISILFSTCSPARAPPKSNRKVHFRRYCLPFKYAFLKIPQMYPGLLQRFHGRNFRFNTPLVSLTVFPHTTLAH